MPLPDLPPGVIDNCVFDVLRPFNSGLVISSGNSGTLVDTMQCGAAHTGGWISFTNILYASTTVDIRDNCSRTSGGNAIVYTDGDEIKLTIGAWSYRFVVVYVETTADQTTPGGVPGGSQTVLLFRHSRTHV
jgi:hypothetical protein